MAKVRKPSIEEVNEEAIASYPPLPEFVVVGADAVVTAYGVTIGYKAGQREPATARTIEILSANGIPYTLE
jgi:hypothetical protein